MTEPIIQLVLSAFYEECIPDQMYRNRVMILSRFYNMIETRMPNVLEMNSSMNVVGLYTSLFRNRPMAIETKHCSDECVLRRKSYSAISIHSNDLARDDVRDNIRNEMIPPHQQLKCVRCGVTQKKSISFTGI